MLFLAFLVATMMFTSEVLSTERPNPRGAADAGLAVSLLFGRQWPRAADPVR